MDPPILTLSRTLTDFLLIFILSMSTILITKFNKIGHRGFFCNDDTIMYVASHHSPLGFVVHVHAIAQITAFCTIALTEYFHERENTQKIKFCRFQLPVWLYNFYSSSIFYTFGVVAVTLTTTILKGCVERLRPVFYMNCLPNIRCSLSENQDIFHTDYECTKNNVSNHLKWLSFPSGHSSFVMYWAIFLIFYTDRRLVGKTLQLLKSTFQFLYISLALYVGLDRIYHYEHFASDVFGGYYIGASCAVLVCINLYRATFFYGEDKTSNVLVDEETILLEKICC